MNSTDVTTELVRFSYCQVFEPKAHEIGDKEKYSVSLLIDKDDEKTLRRIKAAIKAAAEAGKDTKFGGKIPKNLKTPLRDGDDEREDDENYENKMFVNANSVRQPSVVDKKLNAIMDKEEFYSGCYGKAAINFYAYKTEKGVKGIACGLSHLMKVKDGDKLGGSRISLEMAFSDVDDFDDEEDF